MWSVLAAGPGLGGSVWPAFFRAHLEAPEDNTAAVVWASEFKDPMLLEFAAQTVARRARLTAGCSCGRGTKSFVCRIHRPANRGPCSRGPRTGSQAR